MHVQTTFMPIPLLRLVKIVTTIALAALYPTILLLVIPVSQALIELSSTEAVCVTVAILTTGMICPAGIVLWSIPIVKLVPTRKTPPKPPLITKPSLHQHPGPQPSSPNTNAPSVKATISLIRRIYVNLAH
jgi:hypothetical protein